MNQSLRVAFQAAAHSRHISPNAAPIPRIALHTPDFVNIPGTYQLIAFKGHFAHAWLGRDRFVDRPVMHEKYLYLRLFGPDDFPVHAYAGLLHFLQWGGTHPVVGKIPTDFDDYLNVFFGRRNTNDVVDTSTLGNAGNSVLSLDFALEIDFPRFSTLAYRQFYLEAQADLLFRSALDGLWGLRIQRRGRPKLINAFLYEWAYTARQGAKTSTILVDDPRDSSQYYSHSTYQTGWTHQGRTIGHSLLFSDGSLTRPVKNSIVIGHHFAVEGAFPLIIPTSYRILVTYSLNYGSRDDCSDGGCSGNPQFYTGRLDQASGLAELIFRFDKGVGLRLGIAADRGQLYDDRNGVSFALSWQPPPRSWRPPVLAIK